MTTTVADTRDIVQQIAAETNTSAEVVERLYTESLAAFGHDAIVHDFVPLFAAKRVRNALRNAQSQVH